MDVLTGWVDPFHNVYVYQIIMMNTLKILQFYLSETTDFFFYF